MAGPNGLPNEREAEVNAGRELVNGTRRSRQHGDRPPLPSLPGTNNRGATSKLCVTDGHFYADCDFKSGSFHRGRGRR